VWHPPEEPAIRDRSGLEPKPWQRDRASKQLRSPKLRAAIFPAEWEALGALEADLLVTHEAPSCHPHGFEAIDDLARALGVVRAFHGHHHDDRTAEYAPHRDALRFDPIAVGFCAIKTGLGELVAAGEEGW
jgi:hypothetical protein